MALGWTNFANQTFLQMLMKSNKNPSNATTPFVTAGVGSLYIALHGSAPNDAITAGSNNNEITAAGGYTRRSDAIAPDANDATGGSEVSWFASSASGSTVKISLKKQVNFQTSSGAWNSGSPMTHVSIWDSQTIAAGNCWLIGPLGSSLTVGGTGITPTFAASVSADGVIVVTLD